MKMKRKLATMVVAAAAGIGLVAAGCSSQASDSVVSPDGGTVQEASAAETYSIAPTGSVSMGFISAKITGGSISGSTGTISFSALGKSMTGTISDASVSPSSLTATLAIDGTTGSGTLPGSNYVYNGTITAQGSKFTVKGLTLKPQAAAVSASDSVVGAPAATSGNYAVKATGTVSASGTSATITGGSIHGSDGTITVKYWITFTITVSKAAITPTSLSATVDSSLGSGSGTLSGNNYVYSGTITSGSNTITVTDLTLVPTS